MVSIQTNTVIDKRCLGSVSPLGQLPTWLRAPAANRLSESGLQWSQWFALYNRCVCMMLLCCIFIHWWALGISCNHILYVFYFSPWVSIFHLLFSVAHTTMNGWLLIWNDLKLVFVQLLTRAFCMFFQWACMFFRYLNPTVVSVFDLYIIIVPWSQICDISSSGRRVKSWCIGYFAKAVLLGLIQSAIFSRSFCTSRLSGLPATIRGFVFMCALHLILLYLVSYSICFIHARYVFSFKTDDRYNRALLFHREQANILSVEDMQRVMRLNRWQTDPLSLGSSGNAIAARWDLDIQPEIIPQLHWYLGKDG